ncbi:transposase [Caballeronia sp. INDeC2]|uniref:transposase n=1 Tax=Caballeronia sp. INDeC2 TaxID=2921747 RepID=UPI002540871C|nr:transposase [Caballeronia sp. INDeC2]
MVAGDRDLMKALMKDALQEVLKAEMTELLGAVPNERSETRSGYLNMALLAEQKKEFLRAAA